MYKILIQFDQFFLHQLAGLSCICLQAEHENVKTLYFTAETQEDMEAWIDVMSLAAAAELPTRFVSYRFKYRNKDFEQIAQLFW